MDQKVVGVPHGLRLRAADHASDALTLDKRKARLRSANSAFQLQHGAFAIDRRVDCVSMVERLPVFERAIILFSGLEVGLESDAEMFVEHQISPQAQEETVQSGCRLAEAI